MRWKNQIAGLAAAALALGATSAHAQIGQTTSSTLRVLLGINVGCTIGDPVPDLSFGNVSNINAPIPGQTTISVNCTNGLPYSIELGAGQNSTGGTAGRQMKLATGDEFVGYQLYKDSARTLVFGQGKVDAVSKTGTGNPDPTDVYGLVPGLGSTPSAGFYSDMVSAIVTF